LKEVLSAIKESLAHSCFKRSERLRGPHFRWRFYQ
jgi:hypothetical protein